MSGHWKKWSRDKRSCCKLFALKTLGQTDFSSISFWYLTIVSTKIPLQIYYFISSNQTIKVSEMYSTIAFKCIQTKMDTSFRHLFCNNLAQILSVRYSNQFKIFHILKLNNNVQTINAKYLEREIKKKAFLWSSFNCMNERPFSLHQIISICFKNIKLLENMENVYSRV